MIPYHIDQLQRERQQEAYAQHEQDRWEEGYNDAQADQWNGCQMKTSCSRYCKYLAGYHWARASSHTPRGMRIQLGQIDTEFCFNHPTTQRGTMSDPTA